MTKSSSVKLENAKEITETPPTLEEILKLDRDIQLQRLFKLVFPRVKKYVGDALAGKITGMIVDFTLFEVEDIFEFLEDEENLRERIQDAIELIESYKN